MAMSYTFTEELWEYPGNGAWYFITLPKKYAQEIKQISQPAKRGFGSLRVEAKIGSTLWTTSIFPDTNSKSYLLPIKKEIRKINKINAGNKVEVSITLVDIT